MMKPSFRKPLACFLLYHVNPDLLIEVTVLFETLKPPVSHRYFNENRKYWDSLNHRCKSP